MAKQELINLLKESTVFLSSSSGVGTGFFIAPNGWILTCDHVVFQSSNIQVSWLSEEGKQEFTAEVKVRLSEPFDIALLKVKQVIPNHKCVYLDNALPQTGDKLYAFGYPQEYGNTYSGGEPITAEYEGLSFQDERLVALKFRAGQILEGCSGSPLLNLRTGKVCGIIKSSFDSGGRAAPCSLLFQVEKLTNLKSHREIIRDLVQRNKKFHQKDDKTWNKIVKQFYWDRKLALILTIISLVCFMIVWQSEIEDRLILAVLRLIISSGFGYAAILFSRSIKVFRETNNYFVVNSLIGFFTTVSVFLASFLLIVDHAIITRNLTGINFYPTLGLIEDRIPSPLKKVLSINEEPIIDRDNSIYEAVKAFKDESGNSKLSFLSSSLTGLTSAFNKNDRTVRASRPGDTEEKDIKITEQINQTRKDFE
jgi:ABC-type Fe3+-siderophore transport system permease subunit